MRPSEIVVPDDDDVLGVSWWVDYVERLQKEYGCDMDDVQRMICEIQAMTARIVLSNLPEGLAMARGEFLHSGSLH